MGQIPDEVRGVQVRGVEVLGKGRVWVRVSGVQAGWDKIPTLAFFLLLLMVLLFNMRLFLQNSLYMIMFRYLFLQKKPRILPLVAGAHFLILCEQHVQPARENDSRPCHSAVSSSQFQILCIPPVHGKGPLLMARRGSPLRPYKCKLVEPMVTYLEF